MKFNKEIFLLLILAFIFSNLLYAQACRAKVTIKTDLDSSLIFINNNFTGKGNVETELSPGNYLITAEEPSSLWDAKKINDSLTIRNCNEAKSISIKFNKRFYLRTNPQDAYVYSKDSLIGYTPLFVPKYFNSFELKKPGYEDAAILSNNMSANKIVNLNYIGHPNGKNFFQKDLFKILIGGIITLGSVTAYFKLKADDKFSQYQATGNGDYLTQTRKYDLISGISLGALEINFGVLLYYILSD
jgi:hypothetical protein